MAYLATRSSSIARGTRAGRAMGDTASDMAESPVGRLLLQINRFTSRGQYGGKVYRQGGLIGKSILASGNVPADAAYTAAIIYQARLLVAQAGITDGGTASQLAAVNGAMSSGKTQAWVQTNLPVVTEALRGYADSLGLPVWRDDGTTSIAGVSTTTIAILALVGAGAYFLTRRS